jgi:hypothetical protein
MTASYVVIRCGSAYPDAVVDRLESEVADSGLSARIENFGPLTEAVDSTGLIAVELPDDTTDVLLSEALRVSLDALVDAARRRRRRQDAAGELRDVAVTLHLPGDVRIAVPDDVGPSGTDLLMTAVTERRTAGTLAPGTWRWNPATLHLDRGLEERGAPT